LQARKSLVFAAVLQQYLVITHVLRLQLRLAGLPLTLTLTLAPNPNPNPNQLGVALLPSTLTLTLTPDSNPNPDQLGLALLPYPVARVPPLHAPPAARQGGGGADTAQVRARIA